MDRHRKRASDNQSSSKTAKIKGSVEPVDPRIPEWSSFLMEHGIPEHTSAEYAVVFVNQRISLDWQGLKNLNKGYMIDMGINCIGDQIAILLAAKNFAGKQSYLPAPGCSLETPDTPGTSSNASEARMVSSVGSPRKEGKRKETARTCMQFSNESLGSSVRGKRAVDEDEDAVDRVCAKKVAIQPARPVQKPSSPACSPHSPTPQRRPDVFSRFSPKVAVKTSPQPDRSPLPQANDGASTRPTISSMAVAAPLAIFKTAKQVHLSPSSTIIPISCFLEPVASKTPLSTVFTSSRSMTRSDSAKASEKRKSRFSTQSVTLAAEVPTVLPVVPITPPLESRVAACEIPLPDVKESQPSFLRKLLASSISRTVLEPKEKRCRLSTSPIEAVILTPPITRVTLESPPRSSPTVPSAVASPRANHLDAKPSFMGRLISSDSRGTVAASKVPRSRRDSMPPPRKDVVVQAEKKAGMLKAGGKNSNNHVVLRDFRSSKPAPRPAMYLPPKETPRKTSDMIRADPLNTDPREAQRAAKPLIRTEHGRLSAPIFIYGDSLSRGYIFKCPETILSFHTFISSHSGGTLAEIIAYATECINLSGTKELLVIQGGANDVSRYFTARRKWGSPEDLVKSVAETYKAFFREMKRKVKRLVCVGLLPRFDDKEADKLSGRLNGAIEKVCDNHNVVFVQLDDVFRREHIADDEIHLRYFSPRDLKSGLCSLDYSPRMTYWKCLLKGIMYCLERKKPNF